MDKETVLLNISQLGSMNTSVGCVAMRKLETASASGKDVYANLDKLFKLLSDKNPYARTRAFVLIAKNAAWDSRKKIDKNIDKLLTVVTSEPAVTARQCIQSLPLIAKAKPTLAEQIADTLKEINTDSYPLRMREILKGDINNALEAIEK